MKKLISIPLVLLLFITIGCNMQEEGYEPPPAMDVSISYVNDEGSDLLNPNVYEVAYDQFNIYYLQKNEDSGEFERVPARDAQYSFYLDQEYGRVALRVFPNREFINSHSTTLIESPRDDIDTLEVKGYLEGQGAVAEAIWYNGEKVWETAPYPPRRFITITKPEDTW